VSVLHFVTEAEIEPPLSLNKGEYSGDSRLPYFVTRCIFLHFCEYFPHQKTNKLPNGTFDVTWWSTEVIKWWWLLIRGAVTLFIDKKIAYMGPNLKTDALVLYGE